MKTINLVGGGQALVDDQQHNRVNKWTWYKNEINKKTTASCSVPSNEGQITIVEMHRFIMKPKPEEWVVHKDGNGLDNQKKNLEIRDRAEYLKEKLSKNKNAKRLFELYGKQQELEKELQDIKKEIDSLSV